MVGPVAGRKNSPRLLASANIIPSNQHDYSAVLEFPKGESDNHSLGNYLSYNSTMSKGRPNKIETSHGVTVTTVLTGPGVPRVQGSKGPEFTEFSGRAAGSLTIAFMRTACPPDKH
jgi:hypothetical protein